MANTEATPESVTPGATLIYMTTDRGERRSIVRSVTPECLTVDSADGGVEAVKWFDVLDFESAKAEEPPSQSQVQAQIHVIAHSQDAPRQQASESPILSEEQKQVEIDAMLIGAGFDPGIEYIRSQYGEHWGKRAGPVVVEPKAQPHIDLTPVVEGFKRAIDEMQAVHAAQIGSLASALTVLQEKSASTAEIQSALISALNEARKPVEINLKLEMPEQRAKRFVAERDGEGRMTLSEVSVDSQKHH